MDFIKKGLVKHNNFYSYGYVEYINSKTKVIITCPVHGNFHQTPADHLRGYGCKKCSNDYNKRLHSDNTETFIKKAKNIHGDKYDYSLVTYQSQKQKVTIVCPDHGEFKQTPTSHINNMSGCKTCAIEQRKEHNRQVNKEIFIERAKKIHPQFNYDSIDYINANTSYAFEK